MIPQSFVEINFGKIFNSIPKDCTTTVEIDRFDPDLGPTYGRSRKKYIELKRP